MHPSILVLGSGQDGGSPQLGHCTGVGPDRTASSIAVVSPAGSVVLLDVSPDIRLQGRLLVSWGLYPTDRRRFVDAVAVTHGHMGHYGGMLHFGKESMSEQALPLVATASFLGFMSGNEPWRTLLNEGHLHPTPLDPAVEIDPSLSITAIPVPHRAEHTDTVALSVGIDGHPYLLYLPDIDAWEPWSDAEATIARHEIAILDATFSSPDELSGRDMAAVPHPLVPETIEQFAHLTQSTRIVLSHINHTNKLADATSGIATMAVSAGYTIAYDGLEL